MDQLARAVLEQGSEDWVPLVDIDAIQQEQGVDLDSVARIQQAVELVSTLVDEGLVLVGEVTETGFEPWPSRQKERLAEIYELADWAYAAWLCNTDRGNDVARVSLDAET